MKRTFRIDYLPESAFRCGEGFAVVAIDVIRATTMAVTAASLGWRCYPVDSFDAALRAAERFRNPLLAGEINGQPPPGFHINNSPAELAEMHDLLPALDITLLLRNKIDSECTHL
jgi:phosphosulfolactate phosphohydrolase-like enzyme